MKNLMNLSILLVVLYHMNLINAGSYVTSPITRGNQATTQKGCTGPACYGPCESTSSTIQAQNIQTTSRGSPLSIKWPRNGKAGGFVRIAWAVTSTSDTMLNFDTNVQAIYCFEVNCGPADPGNPNGGDNGTPDGSVLPCSVSTTVPTHLYDGPWTMQWAYFGGAFVGGDYFSCVDYNIAGGFNVTSKQRAIFIGGDYSNPTNTSDCKFFNVDKLHVCKNEPCLKPPAEYPGQNDGFPSVIETPPKGMKACLTNADCKSSVCKLDGYCKPVASLLSSGAVAAIVFAVLILVIVILIVIFFLVNKKEVPYMVPFKGRL